MVSCILQRSTSCPQPKAYSDWRDEERKEDKGGMQAKRLWRKEGRTTRRCSGSRVKRRSWAGRGVHVGVWCIINDLWLSLGLSLLNILPFLPLLCTPSGRIPLLLLAPRSPAAFSCFLTHHSFLYHFLFYFLSVVSDEHTSNLLRCQAWIHVFQFIFIYEPHVVLIFVIISMSSAQGIRVCAQQGLHTSYCLIKQASI